MMQNQMGQMPPPMMPQNQMGQMPPPMMQQNIRPRDGSPINLSASSNKAPRLVIRSTSTSKLVDNIKVSTYKPMVIKPSFEIKPSFDKPSFSVKSSFESTNTDKSIEVQILKPCTNCQNQTSLSCKVCQKAFCNVHIDVSLLKCQSCANPEKKEDVSDKIDQLE